MVIQTGLIFAGVAHGFGKTGEDVSNSELAIWQKVWFFTRPGPFGAWQLTLVRILVHLYQ